MEPFLSPTRVLWEAGSLLGKLHSWEAGRGEMGALVLLGGGFHLPRGISSSVSSSLSLSLSRSRCNSLPSPHDALSSLLLQNQPKVLLLDSRVVRIHGPLPPRPSPTALALGKGRGSSLLARTQHDLGDEVDDGGGRLVGVELSEEVAGVVCAATLLPGHEAEELSRGASLRFHPLPFLWIQVTEGDGVEGVVSSEEELSLVIGQCDSLGRHLEVNNGGSWRGVSSQRLRCGFGDGLRPRE